VTGAAPPTNLGWNSTDHLPKEQEHAHSVDGEPGNGSLQVPPASPSRRFDPTHILGCSREQALQLFRGRPVPPGEAEAIAAKAYAWRRHLHDADSYWITTGETARILHLAPPQVKRLLDRGQLPHVRHISRVRLMRRAQIEAIAARRA
jgi:hypothetical protein